MKQLFTSLIIFTILTSPFTLASHASTIQLPQTGQTKCYDEVGSTTTCTGTGQDGELQAGLASPNPRFTDNGDQTLTDHLTGLIWTKDANPDAKTNTWQQALVYIKSLNSSNYLGHNDWRLPNRNELATLLNQGQNSSAVWLTGFGFTNIQSDYFYYWSSTSFASNPVEYAWAVNMEKGHVDAHAKSSEIVYVWPVRTGQSWALGSVAIAKTGQTSCYDATGVTISCSGTGQDGEHQSGATWPTLRFTDNSVANSTDKTLTDNLTGLIWSKDATPDSATKTWQQALLYIKSLNSSNYLGYNDWRLPNRNELESVVHRGESNPGTWLTGQGFIGKTDAYWSSNRYMTNNDNAWFVNMYQGTSSETSKNDPHSVWPVRSFVDPTKAKVFLGNGDNFTVSNNSGASLYGSAGIDTVTIAYGAKGVILDQNIDIIIFPGTSSIYTFKQTGNIINVYDSSGNTLIAKAPVQGDSDGTVLSFSDGKASAKLTGVVMNLGSAIVSSTAPTSLPPPTADRVLTTTSNTTKANIFLGADDKFTVSNSGAILYGSSGADLVTIVAGVSGTILDQNIEQIVIPGASSSYTFQQTGNIINVLDSSGNTRIVKASVQGDSDGTLLGLSDVTASAKLIGGGVMTLGGKTVSANAPGVLTVAPVVSILFDYTYDANGFFTPERRALMTKAATALTSRMKGTTWARVDTDVTGGNYDLAFINPSTLATRWDPNVVIPENQITIYLGAINFTASPFALMQGSNGDGTTQLMSIRNVSGGIGNVLTSSARYRPINATITFDLQGIQSFGAGITRKWHFDSDGDLNTDDRNTSDPHYGDYSDFYTAAVHELGHVMGIHNPQVFSTYLEFDTNFALAYLSHVQSDGLGGFAFTGTNAKQLYYNHVGQNIPLEVSSKCHWADGVRSVTANGWTSINHNSNLPFRNGFSELEFGALKDIGYTISSM
jgi:hypothetical protein